MDEVAVNNQYLMETALKNLSSGELMQLAERKMKIEEQRPQPLPPEEVDLTALRAALEAHIEEIATDGSDTDTPHYIFEAALEAFYGKEIWSWVNSLDR